MAIFPHIRVESVVQVNDRIRIDATRSYTTKDEAAVSLVEIEPEAGFGFIDVTGANIKDWFLDFQFATDGTKSISVRVTTDGAPSTVSKDIVCLTKAEDNLFSEDQDLTVHESDILRYVRSGRNSFKNKHRESQRLIMEHLYKIGVVGKNGTKLTKASVVDVEEVKDWSKFLTLSLIFADQSTVPGDFFEAKSDNYLQMAEDARHRSIIKLDFNGDGNLDRSESLDITWRRLRRV